MGSSLIAFVGLKRATIKMIFIEMNQTALLVRAEFVMLGNIIF